VAAGKKNPFKGRQFTAEIILRAVRWYLQFPISYRDLERMFADRGIQVDHTTLFRWIQTYAPELEKRIRPHLRTSNDGSVAICTWGQGYPSAVRIHLCGEPFELLGER
jgi:transposase-like protein